LNHRYYAIVAAVRLVDAGPQVLLAERAEGRYLAGTWHFMGGAIEAGETAWAAAVRELREESGLRPDALYRLSTVTAFYRPDVDALCSAIPFCAVVAPGADVILSDEHSAFGWYDFTYAAGRLMWKADRQALEEIKADLVDDEAKRERLRVAPFVPHRA
jgi:dATP pyrophosphohydrolase